MGVPHHHLKHIHKKVPVHPAHPAPPDHFQPPAAPVQQHMDVQGYLTALSMSINRANSDWSRFGHAAQDAYAWAWHEQSRVLREVRESIEKRKKAEEADAMFALNLLTCGIGGGLAGMCAKKVLSWGEAEISEKFVEKMVDVAKDKGGEGLKKAGEWMYKHLDHPAPEDAFSPPGIEPVQFGAQILEGIEYRAGAMWDLALDLQQQALGGLSLDGVRAVYESIQRMPFITERPDRRLSAEALKPKALFALWLSWGWGRDVEYWRTHSISPFNVAENMDFEPVRKSLIICGIPEGRISQYFRGGYKFDMRQVQKLAEEQKKDWGDVQMINMSGYIDFCNSQDCIEVLFHGLPRKLEWFNQIPVQLQLRKALGPYARYLKN